MDDATIERSPRSTITPDRSSPDDAGKNAIAFLAGLGQGRDGVVVDRTIGEGGMGIVRAARQIAMGREVALKTLKDDARTEAATLKLLREAWVTGSLEHPNVVPVYDVSLDATGHPQIILKKIAGDDWASLMHDEAAIRRRFSARDAFEWNIRILMQVCNAIHFAHSRGILHRDLKPENVMVGQFGEVYVLDWGIAVALEDDGTGRFPLAKDATDMAGTPAYMAPEMLGGQPAMLTVRTDVYLLGALLYEIVRGAPPHQGANFQQLVHSIMASTPEFAHDTPIELRTIIERAMNRDSHGRFENAEQLRLALSGFLEHRGSLALADEATIRLAELDEERQRTEGDPDEKRLRLYHLFGECRFGFLEALRIWRDNERARAGLDRAIETMIELELDQGDPKAAELLFAELSQKSAALEKRLQTAKEAQRGQDSRVAALQRDHDPAIGRRTRVFLGLVFGTIWTISPLLRWWVESNGRYERSHTTYYMAAMLAFAVVVAGWARDSLTRTAINRRLAWTVGVVLAGQVALLVTASVLDIEYAKAHVLLLFFYSVMSASAVPGIDFRLWPSTLGFVSAFVIACRWPSQSYFAQACANLLLMINVLVLWTRIEEDVVTPLRDRRDQRTREWRDFLARIGRRERESLTGSEGASPPAPAVAPHAPEAARTSTTQ